MIVDLLPIIFEVVWTAVFRFESIRALRCAKYRARRYAANRALRRAKYRARRIAKKRALRRALSALILAK